MRHRANRRIAFVLILALVVAIAITPAALGGIATSPLGVKGGPVLGGLGSCPLGVVRLNVTP
jgi:hypothetical protein